MFPVRRHKTGVLIREHIHLICLTLRDKVRAVKVYTDSAALVLEIGYVAVTGKHVEKGIALIAKVVCILDAASLYLHNFFIQFMNPLSDGINIFDCILYLFVQVALILLK